MTFKNRTAAHFQDKRQRNVWRQFAFFSPLPKAVGVYPYARQVLMHPGSAFGNHGHHPEKPGITLFPGLLLIMALNCPLHFQVLWGDGKNDDWRKTLCEVLYWYLNANSPPRGLEAGIILTQAAIERLSYEFTVKDRCLVSVDRFKKHRASDKFRLLFSSLKIPLDIPAEASELQNSAHGWKKEKWLDAPHALTEIRNSLVHPEHKRSDWSSSTSYEAWNLGLWYLEMGILSICGYKGTYGDRRKQRTIGQVKTVPWK